MDETVDAELAQLVDLVDIEIGRREKRPLCTVCCRPIGVCWCQSFDGRKISTKCKIMLLQHPHEEKRCLRTSPILKAFIPEGHYIELKGKKFSPKRFPLLNEVFNNKNSIVLYPGEKALSLDELPPVSEIQAPYNILILDGTWQQAKSIFNQNPYLRDLRQVCLSGGHISKYAIRTQPTEDSLSTVETAAVVLSTLENDWNIYSMLTQPLDKMVKYQMDHGAVKHHSKEYLITSGKYKKPMGKKTFKKLKKSRLIAEAPTMEELPLVEETDVKNQIEVHTNSIVNAILDTKLSYVTLDDSESNTNKNGGGVESLSSVSEIVENKLTNKINVACTEVR